MRITNLLVLFVCLLLITGPVSASDTGGSYLPLSAIQPPVAEDINPDPDIVEIMLTATVQAYDFGTGNETEVWTYNETIPGPTIEAKIGDKVIIHFTNMLPEETTIHWHGLELPANMDGSHIAQNPIPANGGTFTYEFDLLRAATFWYHPHIRTNEQVEKGLYGAFIVRDPDQDAALELPENEHVLVLDDILLDGNGNVMEPFPSDPLERAAMQVNGREGNTLLVNGKAAAYADTIAGGIPHRFRIINTANSRFMRISFQNHRVWRIGGDGGLLEAPIEVPPIDMVTDPHGSGQMISNPDENYGILLTPAERADVVVTPLEEGPLVIEWHDIARGRHSVSYDQDGNIALGHVHNDGHGAPQVLATLHLDGPPAQEEYMPPSSLRDITPIDTTGAEKIVWLFGHGMPTAEGDVTFFAQMKNGMPLPFNAVTAEDAPSVEVGDIKIWEVHNLTGGDHNYHTHGFHFQHLETEFVDMDNPENNYVAAASHLEDKDTIKLPRRPGARLRSRTITRLAVEFSDVGREGTIEAYGRQPTVDRSGGWLVHCHILEHSATGMMSFFQVQDQTTDIVDVPEVPEEFHVFQNYPNPFNPETAIRFRIANTSKVTVKIYNILGEEIRVLVNNKAYEAGTHTVHWDATNQDGIAVASGVYFYQVLTDNFSTVRRMTLAH